MAVSAAEGAKSVCQKPPRKPKFLPVEIVPARFCPLVPVTSKFAPPDCPPPFATTDCVISKVPPVCAEMLTAKITAINKCVPIFLIAFLILIYGQATEVVDNAPALLTVIVQHAPFGEVKIRLPGIFTRSEFLPKTIVLLDETIASEPIAVA